MRSRIRLSSVFFLQLSATISFLSATTGPAHSQDIIAADTTTIEEIVVTTRKREENLQEVPISIGVFNSDDILRNGIRDLADITKLSPSLQFDKSYSQNSVRVTIRGLSNTRGRANVAFLVDGIDVSSETTGTNAGSPMLINQRMLTDVERIEVVRGPQSALYGRAAFAGAINYISKNPTDEFDFNMQVDIAQHDKEEIFVGISGPITDTLGFRVTGLAWSDDGYYENIVSGEGFGGGEGTGIAGTLLWEPVDTFSLKTRLTYTDDEYTPSAIAGINDRKVEVEVPQDAIDQGVVRPRDATQELLPFVGDADGLKVYSSEDPLTGGEYPGNTLEVFRASLIASWEIGDYTLNSFTGYTDADMSQRYDLDRQAEGRPDEILGHGDIDTFGNTRQISQELRLASNWENSPVQMTLGLQYWNEERDDFSRSIAVTCWNLDFCGPDQTLQPYQSWQDLYAAVEENSPDFRAPVYAETDHRSAYLMLEWAITDTVSLTLEDRFVKEDFDVTLPVWASCLNPFPNNASLSFEFRPHCAMGEMTSDSVSSSYQTPKVTLEWQMTDNAMLYGLAGKGVKPAGISLVRVPVKIAVQPEDTYRYDPEKMWSYEIGAKSQWSGSAGLLVLNGAVFYQDYSDKQTNTQQEFCGLNQGGTEVCRTVGAVTNASAAWVKGLEIETSWVTPLDGLSFGFGYTWLDSEYSDFTDPTRSAGRIAAVGECSEYVLIPEGDGSIHCVLDLSGNKLERMPEHATVVTGRYENSLFDTGMQWFIEGNASYQSERYTSSENYSVLDEFWLADARVGLTNQNWNIMLYVNNLFDDDTISSSGGNTDVAAGYAGAAPALVPPTFSTAFLPPPRTAGLRFHYQYR